MSEPFGLDQGTPDEGRKEEFRISGSDLWNDVKGAWNNMWGQRFVVRRRGETVLQVGLPLAILVLVVWPHLIVLLAIMVLFMHYAISIERHNG